MKTKHNNNVATATLFECHSPEAESVCLAGSFNDWNPETTPLTRVEDGAWQVTLNLAPGRYEYKFVVDGHWCSEPGREDHAGCPSCARNDSGIQCSSCVPNEFGTMNRVIEVTAEPAPGPRQAA